MSALVRATSSIRPAPRSLRYITRLDVESSFGLDLTPTLFGHPFSRVLLRPITCNHTLMPIPLPLPLLLPLCHPGDVDNDGVVGAAICLPNNLRPLAAARAAMV